jgi:hypothetical protein
MPLDAGTLNPDLVHEQRAGLSTLLGLVAAPGMWKVALFEPALERCVFRDAAFAERLFGGSLSKRQRVLAEYDPKRALAELSQERWGSTEDRAELVRRLAGGDLTPLTEEPALREIVEFLREASARSAA